MRRVTVGLTAVILTIGLTAPGFAEDCRIPIFNGDPDTVEMGSWGSGTIEVAEEETYLDNEALTVTTTGFFEGGRIDLKEPIPAERVMADPEGGYLKLVAKAHEPEPEQRERPQGGPGTFPGEGGEFPAGPGGEMPPAGEMPPGEEAMPPGEEMPGEMGPHFPEDDMGMMGPGVGVNMGKPAAPPPKIERLRVLIVTDKGAVDSGPIVLDEHTAVVEDWKQIVIPMTAFLGPVDVSEGEIQQIALFGDVEETFWVGEITLGHEDQPLLADAGENQTTKANEVTMFEAAPQPEGVKALYVWDFDDLNGIQEEGYGRETSWTFLTPGYYTVTLTVSDPGGQKVERTDKVRVRVTE